MANTIREVYRGNPCWRYFERYNDRGYLTGEAAVNIENGEMEIEVLKFGLIPWKTYDRCSPDQIEIAVAQALR